MEVVPGRVYAVHGSFSMKLGFISLLGMTNIMRTMTIVKDEDDNLTLINAFNLSEEGWKRVEGPVVSAVF